MEKTYFSGTTCAEFLSELYAYLTETAKEYFDEISLSDNGYTVSCIYHGKECLRFSTAAGSADKKSVVINVTLDNGTTTKFETYGGMDYVYPGFERAVTASNGFTLFGTETNSSRDVSITKSNKGNLFIVYYECYGNGKHKFYVFDITNSMKSDNIADGNRNGLTAFVPIPSMAGEYTPGLFYTPFSEYPILSHQTIIADGTTYFYGSNMALKE